MVLILHCYGKSNVLSNSTQIKIKKFLTAKIKPIFEVRRVFINISFRKILIVHSFFYYCSSVYLKSLKSLDE